MSKQLVLFSVLVLIISGCSLPRTKYQPMSEARLDSSGYKMGNDGYSDLKISDNLYQITSTGHNYPPDATGPDRYNQINITLKNALLRAANIAIEKGYSHFSIESIEDHATVDELDRNFRYRNKFIVLVRLASLGGKTNPNDFIAEDVVYLNTPELLLNIKLPYNPLYEKDFLESCKSDHIEIMGNKHCACKIRNMGEIIPEMAARKYFFPGKSLDSNKYSAIKSIDKKLEAHCSSNNNHQLISFNKKLPLWLSDPEKSDKREKKLAEFKALKKKKNGSN